MTDRINSIDFLRGLAIIFMIQVHIYYHWIYWTKIDYGYYEEIIFFLELSLHLFSFWFQALVYIC